MKSKVIAYALWALGFMGLGGLHRMYLGKRASGWLYLLTFDLFLLGFLLDFPAIPNMVDEANRALSPPQMPRSFQPLVAAPTAYAALAAPPAAPPVIREIIREIVKVRCSYCNALNDQGVAKCPECGGKV